jgi:hypothetical protein
MAQRAVCGARQEDLRCADPQTGAVDRVELPRRQNRHGAGRQRNDFSRMVRAFIPLSASRIV